MGLSKIKRRTMVIKAQIILPKGSLNLQGSPLFPLYLIFSLIFCIKHRLVSISLIKQHWWKGFSWHCNEFHLGEFYCNWCMQKNARVQKLSGPFMGWFACIDVTGFFICNIGLAWADFPIYLNLNWILDWQIVSKLKNQLTLSHTSHTGLDQVSSVI